MSPGACVGLSSRPVRRAAASSCAPHRPADLRAHASGRRLSFRQEMHRESVGILAGAVPRCQERPVLNFCSLAAAFSCMAPAKRPLPKFRHRSLVVVTVATLGKPSRLVIGGLPENSTATTTGGNWPLWKAFHNGHEQPFTGCSRKTLEQSLAAVIAVLLVRDGCHQVGAVVAVRACTVAGIDRLTAAIGRFLPAPVGEPLRAIDLRQRHSAWPA
jgi:hypothetical protein